MDFPTKKQGELDSACGLYCLVSAGIWFGSVADDANGAWHALTHLRGDWGRASYAEHLLVRKGVELDRLAPLAKRLGLRVDAPGPATYDEILERFDPKKLLWIVMLKMGFKNPRRTTRGTARFDDHYVLVIEANERSVVLADPHPWHRDVYPMDRREFEVCWQNARPAYQAARLMKR